MSEVSQSELESHCKSDDHKKNIIVHGPGGVTMHPSKDPPGVV